MARIHLVRHGKAAAGWDGHPDPGLDDLGRRQALGAAETLAALAPMRLVSSPLARARETAEPLAQRWSAEVVIESRVAEIPSPSDDLADRSRWLQAAMAGTWADLGAPWTDWRDALVSYLLAIDEDTVIFSHFIAINAAVGAARGFDGVASDAIVGFRPDNASITILDNDGGRLRVDVLGGEAVTEIR